MAEIIDVELGHFYLPELLLGGAESGTEFFDRGQRRAEALRSEGADVRFSVLVDDLGEEFTSADRAGGVAALKRELARLSFEPIDIVLESEFHFAGPTLVETLRGNFVLTVEGASYLTIVSQDPFLWAQETLESSKSIKQMFLKKLRGRETGTPSVTQSQFLVPLHTPAERYRPYGCSLLTAAWYLSRLGVEGFVRDSQADRPRADRLVNILPVKYLKSEGFAMDIIRISSATRIRKAAKRIEYVLI